MVRVTGSRKIFRGEIWVVNLTPSSAVGWEIAKKRPALIISANQINSISPLVIIIPISSRIPKVLAVEKILIAKREKILEKDSVALVNQIRAIDKTRLVKKLGKISDEKLEEVEEALKLVLGMVEF